MNNEMYIGLYNHACENGVVDYFSAFVKDSECPMEIRTKAFEQLFLETVECCNLTSGQSLASFRKEFEDWSEGIEPSVEFFNQAVENAGSNPDLNLFVLQYVLNKQNVTPEHIETLINRIDWHIFSWTSRETLSFTLEIMKSDKVTVKGKAFVLSKIDGDQFSKIVDYWLTKAPIVFEETLEEILEVIMERFDKLDNGQKKAFAQILFNKATVVPAVREVIREREAEHAPQVRPHAGGGGGT